MSRLVLLRQLIKLDKPIGVLLKELEVYGWDAEQACVVLYRKDIENILAKSLSQDVSFRDVEQWAEAIECREDIEFEEDCQDEISEVMFNLANPIISGELTENKARKISEALKE
jgi:hypothetical protein